MSNWGNGELLVSFGKRNRQQITVMGFTLISVVNIHE